MDLHLPQVSQSISQEIPADPVRLDGMKKLYTNQAIPQYHHKSGNSFTPMLISIWNLPCRVTLSQPVQNFFLTAGIEEMTRCYFPYAAGRTRVAQSSNILSEFMSLRFCCRGKLLYPKHVCTWRWLMKVMFRTRPKFQHTNTPSSRLQARTRVPLNCKSMLSLGIRKNRFSNSQ